MSLVDTLNLLAIAVVIGTLITGPAIARATQLEKAQ